jgi:sigma-B regulation protein RsbU (phosphoserine phosphatase)
MSQVETAPASAPAPAASGPRLHHGLFDGVPATTVAHIIAGCDERALARGEVLLVQGQANHSVYLLKSGRLGVHFNSLDSAQIAEVEPGRSVGEISLADGQPVSAYVVAKEPSTVVVIPELRFWDLMGRRTIARNLFRMFVDRMRLNTKIIEERLKESMVLEQMRKELRIAASIQLSLVPPGDKMFLDRPDLDVCASMDPAKEVGGDLYDAFLVGDRRLFVAIGDVSGKGVPAALFMARAVTALRAEALRHESPDKVLTGANATLCAGNETSMFVSLFCGVLNLDTGRFCYSNAGHNPPLIRQNGGSFKYLHVPSGIVTGVFDMADFTVGSVDLERDDALLLYTDGVTEAINGDGAMYDEDRLLAVLAHEHDSDAHALVERVRSDVRHFVGEAPVADDITILALRYKGR